MAYNHEGKNKSKRFCIRIVLAVAVIFWSGCVVLWYYAPHLVWKYREWRYDLHDVEKIETGLMPVVDITEDWVEHSYDKLPYDKWQVNLRFHVPPDMSPLEEDFTGTVFLNENTRLQIIPLYYFDWSEILLLATRLHPEHKLFTVTQLRLESWKAGASDFHWSMSRQEALWHAHMVGVVRTVPLYFFDGMRSAEFFAGKNWEGLLFFPKGNYCGDCRMFEWHCMYCSNGGTIFFSLPTDVRRKDREIDMNVVRGIIQSIEIDCGCSSEEE